MCMSVYVHVHRCVCCKLRMKNLGDFPGGAVVKNPPANAGDTGSIPGPEDPTCSGTTKPVRHSY